MTEKKKPNGELSDEEALAIFKGGGANATDDGPLTEEEALAVFHGGGGGGGGDGHEGAAEEERPWSDYVVPDPMALGQGMARGIAAVPGIPGTLEKWIKSLPANTKEGQWIKENLVDPAPQLPTTEDTVGSTIDKILPTQGSKHYVGANKLLERAGEMYLPMPGNKYRAGQDVLTAIEAAVGAEGAKYIAENFGIDSPWTEFIGSILGIYGGHKLQTAKPAKIAEKGIRGLEPAPKVEPPDAIGPAGVMPQPQEGISTFTNPATLKTLEKMLGPAPTREVLIKQRDTAYDTAAQMGEALPTESWAPFSSKIAKEITRRKLVAADEPELAKMVRQLLEKPEIGQADLEGIYQRAGRAAQSGDANKAQLGQVIRENIDDYYTSLESSRPGLKAQVDEARDKGRASFLSQRLAEKRSKGRYGVMGKEIGGMNKVRAYLEKRDESLSPMEQAAGEKAVGRDTARSPLRSTARFFQGGPLKAVSLLASSLSNPWPVIATVGASMAGRKVEDIADVFSSQKMDEMLGVFRAGKGGQRRAEDMAAKINKSLGASSKMGILGAFKGSELEREREEERERRRRERGLPSKPK